MLVIQKLIKYDENDEVKNTMKLVKDLACVPDNETTMENCFDILKSLDDLYTYANKTYSEISQNMKACCEQQIDIQDIKNKHLTETMWHKFGMQYTDSFQKSIVEQIIKATDSCNDDSKVFERHGSKGAKYSVTKKNLQLIFRS